jgi:hypothetical protein
MPSEIVEWEARAELEVGVLIHSYLLTHPAPGESEMAARLQSIAEDLQTSGRMRVSRWHRRPLVAIKGGAGASS